MVYDVPPLLRNMDKPTMNDEPAPAPEIAKVEPPGPGMQGRFGRLPAVDHRDKQPRFAMAAPPTTRTYRYWISRGVAYDQGWTSQCVAYSTDRYLITDPIRNKLPWSHEDFYHECQRNDEWDGEDYDGTSVRAAFKVLQAHGYVTEYHWAFEAEPVIRHVLEIGPVVMGTDWTTGMIAPDKNGYLWPQGSITGGHAWLIIGVNRNRKNPDGTVGAAQMLNSWGPQWGDKGRAWLTFKALEQLIAGLADWPGEAATAKEVRVK